MVNVDASCYLSGFEVLHTAANRVRLRAADTNAQARLDTVAQQLRQQDGVRAVRTNEQTGSLVIFTEPNRLPLEQLEKTLPSEEPRLSPKARADTSWLEAYSQACTRLQSFIPPIVGLMSTRWLGMYGWKAISTYLIATGLTREVIDNLDLGLLGLPQGKSQETATSSNGFSPPVVEEPAIQQAEVACKIVHQLPGRIRFHIPRIAQNLDYAKKIQSLAEFNDRITAVRINRVTASAVITYKVQMPLDSSELIALIQSVASRDTSKRAEAQVDTNPKHPSTLMKPREEEALVTDSQTVGSKEINHKDSLFPDGSSTPAPQEVTEEMSEAVASVSEIATEEAEEAVVSGDDQTIESPESKISDEVDEFVASFAQPLDEAGEEMVCASDSIESTEPPTQKQTHPWSRFKSCVLAAMLKLMANLPVQQART